MERHDDAEPVDDIDRAHLADPTDRSFTIARYPSQPHLADLVRRYWVPVWAVPDGDESPQKVLQYPVCLIVVASEYARFYGPTRGLSTTTLSGRGWAAGVMLQPAAGFLLTGQPVSRLADRHIDLTDIPTLRATELVRAVHLAMRAAPAAAPSHRAALLAFAEALRGLTPVDDEGRLVNDIVALVENSPDLMRVDDLCAILERSERSLQRLLLRRVGVGPKWLIRRRRLHEAVARLREGGSLADLSARLGYADQAHFTRDFRRSTGLTPGAFAATFTATPSAPIG